METNEPSFTGSVDEWRKRFDEVQRGLPELNAVLTTRDGTPAKLSVECRTGFEPLIFGRAYVPQIVGEEPRWVLQTMEETFSHGLKVILKYKDRNAVIKKEGLSRDAIPIKSLIVVGHAQTKSSVQAIIGEWK